MSRERPSYCCHPDCFNCPYPDCKWDGNAIQYRYNHSDKGIENQKRKCQRRIESGKNAERCRKYYREHREEILEKKRRDRARTDNARRCRRYYLRNREEILEKKRAKILAG